MAVSSNTLLLSAILSLLLLLPSPSTANENNIFITGDILPSNGQLTETNGAVLVMQDDCNLVLYNSGKGFQTGTSGLSSNCTLHLSEFGQLLVKKSNGEILWASPYTGAKGEYAVILQPDGQLGFYGPSLWNTPYLGAFVLAVAKKASAAAEPAAANLLFSSEVLTGQGKLASRDYVLEVAEGCNLRLTKASVGATWETGSRSSSANCFARLNFHGQLTLLDDDYKVLFETAPGAVRGIYALVVKITGHATIYGYRYWSTALAA